MLRYVVKINKKAWKSTLTWEAWFQDSIAWVNVGSVMTLDQIYENLKLDLDNLEMNLDNLELIMKNLESDLKNLESIPNMFSFVWNQFQGVVICSRVLETDYKALICFKNVLYYNKRA